MNKANQYRHQLASEISQPYANHPKVAAIALTGSVARGWADKYSDIELHVFWSEPATDADRRNLIQKADGKIFQLWEREDDGWSESFHVEAVKVDLSSFLVSTTEKFLNDVVDQADTDLMKQLLVSSINNSVALQGACLMNRWKAKSENYPDELSTNIIKKYLRFGPRWGPEMLVARDDQVFLYHLVNQMQQQIMGVLHGLNRIYISHPQFKWLDQTIAKMALKPQNLSVRLKDIYDLPPVEAVRKLQQLIEEVFELVETQLPRLDIESEKAWFQRRRTLIEARNTQGGLNES
jgi:predicted nucleotidyltransferase